MNQPPDNDQGAPPNNHDAGDALLGMLTPGANPVRPISVMPRAMVGRFGMSAEIGFLSVLPQNGERSGLPGCTDASERTRQRIFGAETLDGSEAYAAAGVQPPRGATPAAELSTVAAS
jgi:ATP-dependent Zn protease